MVPQMSEKQKQTPKTDELRKQHQDLLDAASRQPGVAEAMKAYGRLTPHLPVANVRRSVTRYATGGNPS
jgi:hypothetical protein